MPLVSETVAPPFAVSGSQAARVSGFRTRLLIAMMVVVSGATALTLYVAQRNLTADIERELQTEFQSELAALHHAQSVRHATLVERCRALVRKSRIHAALEDGALDLLYPSAEDELRDIMLPGADDPTDSARAFGLHARFYRFLDHDGRVIPPPPGAPVGAVDPHVAASLALPRLDAEQQVGFVEQPSGDGSDVTALIATPIISTENGEVIAALVLGFRPFDFAGQREMKRGVWTNHRLHFAGLSAAAQVQLSADIAAAAAAGEEGRRRLTIDGAPHLMFFKRLNPGSLYPPAFEVSLYPLDQFSAQTTRLRWQVAGMGALLLVASFLTSRVLAARLSRPVERLAADSERSARFSADASHQLKTPVSVLRAGLEELLARDNLTPDECDAIAALIHQTYRLSSLIEDLLLLSRMDSGRLKLALQSVDLAHLIAAALDDLSAMPDPLALQIETNVPPVLRVLGEQRYTAMILHNLLENARKYNRPGGRISISAQIDGDGVRLLIGNTGRPIAPAAQARIFERFHRGAIGEDVPGYGLGLNLARELARLHEGDLRLVQSAADWTEFELRFRVAPVEVAGA
jgi:signal transduction histidine kinase